MTNDAELVEFVLLPHNDDVTKPHALNTFLNGLAELGVDKGVIGDFKTSRTFLFLHFTFLIRASNVVKTCCLILQVVKVIRTHS